MHYFTKFANCFINNCEFDIKFKLGYDTQPQTFENFYREKYDSPF